MVVRMRIAVEQDEYSALMRLAVEELRNVEEQARFIIRHELIHRGLLHDGIKSLGNKSGENET